jgi:large subunit ribosomal protein L21
MENFAIIKTGGKQYLVKEGDQIEVEKLKGQKGESVELNQVLLLHKNNETKIGTPYVANAKVVGKIVEQKRGDKKIIFRYHSKTRYRKLKGHRQFYTKLIIEKI